MTRRTNLSPADRRARLSRARRAAHGWPFCEHDGVERIIATAAEHVVGISAQHFPPPMHHGLIGGIEQCAAETRPDDLIGLCPACFCMTWRDAPAHRLPEAVKGGRRPARRAAKRP